MRKLKSFWALLCLLLVSSSVAMGQDDTGFINGGTLEWKWYASTGKLMISGTGSMKSGTPGYSAYKTKIKTVEMSGGVTDVCASAFQDYSALTSVSLGAGVTTIGDKAFRNCDKLTSISIPSSVTSIGATAFYSCDLLATVTFNGTNLKTIGQEAFSYCPKLTSVSLPSSVTTISNWAFRKSGLTSFTVPAKCTSCYAPVSGCPITSLSVASGNTTFTVSGDLLLMGGNTIVATNKAIEKLDIPYNVTTIQSYVFEDCTSLVNIIHGWKLTAIGAYAFQNCTGLKGIFLTNSNLKNSTYVPTTTFAGVTVSNIYFTSDEADVRTYFKSTLGFTKVYDAAVSGDIIWYLRDGNQLCVEVKQGRSGDYAMPNCTSTSGRNFDAIKSVITSISFPRAVRQGGSSYNYINKIGDYAFYGLSKVTSLSSSYFDYVTSIGQYAFSGCSSLNSANWSSDFDVLTSIGNYAFSGCAFTSLNIPSVTTIGTQAFYNNKITSITLPAVTSIGASAFASNSLTTLSLPSTLKTIGNSAFCNNSSLGAVTIPASVNSIGTNPFYNCPNVSFTSSSSSYVVSNKCLYNSSKTTLIAGVKNGTINSGTTTIAADAFYGLGSTTLTIPSSVTTFNDDCFGNNSFTSIIDNRTSVTSASLTPAKFNDNTKTNCKVQVLNTTVKKAYTDAGFDAANVMVTSCGTNATWSFDPATGALTISGSGDITSCTQGNYPWNAVMSQIKKLNISASITSIPDYAFFNASNMASTNMETTDKVKSIGAYAFNGTALTAIYLPTVLTTIGNYAFANTKLANPIIPASVTSIGNGILASAPLATITVTAGNGYYKAENGALLTISGKTLYALAKNKDIPATVTKISGYALSNGVTTVTIPASVTAYDDYWASGASAITKLTVLSTTKPSAIGNLSKTACEIHVGSPVQTTAKSIYSNWKTSLGFSKVVYDYCGTNLTWSVSSNKLTITKVNETGSTGAMWNFTSGATATTLPWYSSKGTITSVAIGSGVTTVGDYAFQNCGAITSVTIPNTVTMIGAGAFSGATKLASITLPSALTSIGENAFQSTAIKSLSIPATVTVIGAFGANSIQTIKVDPANASFTSQDKSGNELNMLLTKDGKSLYLCPATTDNVTLPSTLTTVKAGAFNGAVGKLTIPAKVTTMSAWPTSATSIHAANEPTSTATVPSTLKSVKVYASSAAVQTKYKGLGFTNVVVGTSCGSNASYFFENGVLTIVGSGAVTSAPWLTDANIGAAKIKRVVVETGISSLCAGAFLNCTNLVSAKLPEGLANMGNTSFNGCTSLKSIVLPSTVAQVGDNDSKQIFYNSGVESIKIAEGPDYSSKDLNGNEINAMWYQTEPLKALRYSVTPNIGSYVWSVGPYAVKTQSVDDLNIPANIINIYPYAFANLNIKNIYSASTATIPANAFNATIKTKAKVYVASDAIKAKFVAAGFTEANIKVATGQCGADMYYYVNGKKLIIFGGGDMYESGLTWAGGATAANAFTSIQFVGNAINTIGKNAFSACTAVKGEIVIPASVTKIGAGAFGSTLITSVVANGQKPASMAATGFTADVYAKASLVVPDDARDSYLEATGWENFGGVQTTEEMANPYDLNKDGRVNGTDVNFLKGKF